MSGRIVDMTQWEAGNHAAQAGLTNAMFDWIDDDRKPIDIPFDPPDDLFTELTNTLSNSNKR